MELLFSCSSHGSVENTYQHHGYPVPDQSFSLRRASNTNSGWPRTSTTSSGWPHRKKSNDPQITHQYSESGRSQATPQHREAATGQRSSIHEQMSCPWRPSSPEQPSPPRATSPTDQLVHSFSAAVPLQSVHRTRRPSILAPILDKDEDDEDEDALERVDQGPPGWPQTHSQTSESHAVDAIDTIARNQLILYQYCVKD